MNPLHTIDLAALHRMDLEREARRNWITRSTERPPRRLATALRRVFAVGSMPVRR